MWQPCGRTKLLLTLRPRVLSEQLCFEHVTISVHLLRVPTTYTDYLQSTWALPWLFNYSIKKSENLQSEALSEVWSSKPATLAKQAKDTHVCDHTSQLTFTLPLRTEFEVSFFQTTEFGMKFMSLAVQMSGFLLLQCLLPRVRERCMETPPTTLLTYFHR